MSHLFFFFFSSRRRHTRWPRDWSSDVCSSDLDRRPLGARPGRRCRGADRCGARRDRKSVVQGKSVDLGGRRIIKKKKSKEKQQQKEKITQQRLKTDNEKAQ